MKLIARGTGRGKAMKHILPALFLLAACAPAPSDDVAAQNRTDTEMEETRAAEDNPLLSPCLNDRLRALVGQPVSTAPGLIPETARVIGPGDLYTQDYLPDRVNVDHDANGVIMRVWCG